MKNILPYLLPTLFATPLCGQSQITGGGTTSTPDPAGRTLNIAEGCGSASNAEFSRFLGYAYRSLKEVVTALELCQRLYSALSQDRLPSFINEGNQISRMTYNLMQKLDPGTSLR